MQDTIYAFATPEGRSAIAIVRISGPACLSIQRALIGRVLAPRLASLCHIVEPSSGEILDQALALSFPGPNSFTGEDCLELYVHGGRAVRNSISATLAQFEGVRTAKPGEFTRRAFVNGKSDLTRIEGLADLIDSETEQQRRLAISQMQGMSTRRCDEWRNALLRAMALIEATIDFADEDDAPKEVLDEVIAIVDDLRRQITEILESRHRGEIIREGFRVAIAGPPNSGKSSLINYLANRDVAIVTDIPGTTRDVLEVRIDVDGHLVRLFDTAGLRDTADPVETIGISRARSTISEADLTLWLTSVTTDEIPFAPETDKDIRVWTMCDLDPGFSVAAPALAISVRNGAGIPLLIERISEFVTKNVAEAPPPFVRDRHFSLLRECQSALGRFLDHVSLRQSELLVEELRVATLSLSHLVGSVETEDVLGEIFSRFCIGK